MYNHLLYFSYWIVNSFVLSLIHFILPEDVILGNSKLTALDASVYSGFWVTFVTWIFWDFLLAKKYDLGKIKTFFYFWFANIVGIWITSHMSSFTGLGTSSIYLIVIVGLLTNLIQREARKIVIKKL